MDIAFKNKKLEKSLTRASDIKATYGHLAKRIAQRMESLKAAENLAVVQSLAALECHPLTGDRKSQWAVSISGNWRLVFEIDEIPLPKREDNSIDTQQVTHINIVEITDYH